MISIITPVYNGKRFMEFCIKNVIDQNCPDVEHIIVDGGSTDGTVDIIKKYAENYKHIRWVSEKDNGQSDAMNKGVAMARGAILGFLNVDDYYEPGVLCEIIEMFRGLPKPSLLVGNCVMWDDEGRVHYVSKPSRISFVNMLLERYGEAFPMNPSAYFYHKSLHDKIGMFKVDEHFGMDVHFIFQAVQNAHIKYVDRMWGNYRYLKGTKTYIDNESGRNPARVKSINEYYRKQAPIYYKLYIASLKVLMRVLYLMSCYRSEVCRVVKSFTHARNN